MNAYLAVFLGAGLGGALRHSVNIAALRLIGSNFPLGTVAINVAGSFIMGLFAAWFALKADSGQTWRLFLTTGILGGFTTFSTFSLDAALLWERGQSAVAVAYVVVSVVLALAGLFAGLLIMRYLS